MSSSTAAIYSAIAAGFSAIAALIMVRIERRNILDSTRPELMLSGWNRNKSAIVKITHKYDYNGELAGTSNEILDIKEVIQVNSP